MSHSSNAYEHEHFGVTFGGNVHLVLLRCYVDIDGYGDVLGIEILDGDFIDSYPQLHLPPSSGPARRLTLDSEAGAAYLRLREGKSTTVLPCLMAVVIDQDQTVLTAQFARLAELG